jgi:hypothetical protein
VWFKSCSGFLIARLTYSPPISFYVGDLFLRDILISFLVAKKDEFRHMIFKYAQYAVTWRNLKFTSRKMYANGRFWEAKLMQDEVREGVKGQEIIRRSILKRKTNANNREIIASALLSAP